MRTHQAVMALAGLFTLAACGRQQDGSTTGLTGEMRTSFVQTTIAQCTQAAQEHVSRGEYSAEAATQYCTCSSNAVADRTNSDQLRALNALKDSDPTQARALMQPMRDAAINACGAILRNPGN